MKKIVTAAAAALVLAGTASADITLGINSRTRPSLYTKTQSYADSKDASNTSTLLDFGAFEHSDDLTFSGNVGYAGVIATMTIANDQFAATNGLESTVANKDGTTASYELDGEYWGWIQFGNLTLTGGKRDSRFISRHNTTLIEDGLTDSSTAKYGVSCLWDSYLIAPTEEKTFLYDFNNFTAIAGSSHLGVTGEYTVENIGDEGTLLFRAGIFANKYSTTSYDEYEYIGAGFAAEVGYDSKSFALQAICKNPTQHTFGFGLYGDIKAVEKLSLALGFTYGLQNQFDYETSAGNKTTVEKWSALAFDLRAFYQVMSPLTVGLQAKYSSYKADGKDGETALETILTGQYELNEVLAFQLDAGLFLTDLDDNDSKDYAESYLLLRPGLMLRAGENATVTTAVNLHTALNGDDADTEKNANITKLKLTIPLILRVQL